MENGIRKVLEFGFFIFILYSLSSTTQFNFDASPDLVKY